MLVFLLMALLLGVSQSVHRVAEKTEKRLTQDEREVIKDELEQRLEKRVDERQTKLCDSRSTSCEKVGGYCFTETFPPECYYVRYGFCNSTECGCCIDCEKIRTKSECEENGGICRNCQCNADEYLILVLCAYSSCMCCRPCDTTEECEGRGGKCVGDVLPFIKKGWKAEPSIKCKQPECTCVIGKE